MYRMSVVSFSSSHILVVFIWTAIIGWWLDSTSSINLYAGQNSGEKSMGIVESSALR